MNTKSTPHASLNLLERARRFRTKKSLGQNFLVNQGILERITDVPSTTANKNLLEIGPGIGFLTELLLDKEFEISALDFDKEALDSIPAHPRLQKIHQDALQFNFDSLAKPFIVAGNLPFNVGTQILLNFIGEFDDLEMKVAGIQEMVLMFQLEVAERIAAKPGSKAFGPISMLVQSKCEVKLLFSVPKESFQPIPKVNAGVLHIVPRQESLLAALSREERIWLRKIMKAAFSTRRKQISNSLKSLIKAETFVQAGIESSLRPEQMSLEQFSKLAKLSLANPTN
jgi:16S rRNA (adenine1518-N6/adenine1519-N6)-dimethyltransferase